MLYAVNLVLLLTLSVVTPAAWTQESGPQKKPAEKQVHNKQQKAGSLTGCVDQQDGRYVLIDGQSRNLIANLEADGFPVEGFAKHLGHKVTVRGTSNAESAQPLFRVRSVEPISDVCAPQYP